MPPSPFEAFQPKTSSQGAFIVVERYEFKRPRLFSPDLPITVNEAEVRLSQGQRVVISKIRQSFDQSGSNAGAEQHEVTLRDLRSLETILL